LPVSPTLVAVLPLVASVSSAAATPTDLFFSEYRGVEQQQGARDLQRHRCAVDLTAEGYNVQMFFNGSVTRRAHDQPDRNSCERRRLCARKALPDPSGTYRAEMTLPDGQVVTASFGVKP
jgi:hypothetical protein